MKAEWSNSGELLAVAGRVSFIILAKIIMMMTMMIKKIVVMVINDFLTVSPDFQYQNIYVE